MHSKKSLYPEIEKTIRFLHDYETAEISYHEIKGSAEFLNWIQSETTNQQWLFFNNKILLC